MKLVGLSEREHVVLSLVADGYRSREIAKKLGISVKTVESHRATILDKLCAYTMPEAVKRAIEQGLIRLEASA